VKALTREVLLALLLTLPSASALAAPPAASVVASPAAAGASGRSASPARPAQTVNNGHEAPAAAGDQDSNQSTPPGQPALGGNDAQTDVSEASPGLEPGTISATVVNERGLPLAGQQVRLGILFQKIAEGEARSEKFAQADAAGTVQFAGLTRGSDHAYRITVQAGPASYQTSPFNLKSDMGQRVVLHVFPSTSDVERAAFGMRGYLYVETRDDVFQFEALFRVFNVGQITWVPKDVVLQLPSGFKAFKAQEGMTDVRFEAVDGVGARLKGTFSPGQNEASFRFQMPKSNEDTAAFQLGLPPHVAEMRVIAEASSSMNLDVAGFQPPVATANNRGQRVLVSVKQLLRGDPPLKDFVATLSGIPTPGPGRWFAVLIACSVAASGVFAARGAFDAEGGGKDLARDKKRARELLLRELVLLETARRAERIGPRSYEQSRTALIDAVARIGLAPRPALAAKDGRAGSLRKRAKPAANQS
jgi:hypothetical protein